MKIQVLGTAAATSMPLAFCNCPVCKKSRALGGKNLRKRASIVINDDLLIDLGPDSITACQMYGIDAGALSILLQTHSHSDHFDAGHFVTRMSGYATKDLTPLNIICSRGTATDMNHWIKENEDLDLFSPACMDDLHYKLTLVNSGDTVQAGDYRITAIDSGHDPRVEAMIYAICSQDRSLLYGTDLLELTDDTWKLLRKFRFDVIFLDQTYGEGFNAGGHTDAGMLKVYIKKMKELGIADDDTQILATHISHEGNDIHEIMENQAAACGYHIAYDGMTVEC